MRMMKKLLSLMLSAALILCLIPGLSAKASPDDGEFAAKKIRVSVVAYSLEEHQNVPVEGAYVTLKKDDTILAAALSNEEGIAVIPLDGIPREDLLNATVQAFSIVDRTAATYASGREDLYQHFPKDDDGNMYRLEYQLHSETIDENGTWRGRELPFSTSSQADIVFLVDATGSMENNMENVRENLREYLISLDQMYFDFRYSVIEYRDCHNGEDPMIYERGGSHWFTDIDKVIDILSEIRPDGGGDAYAESLGDTVHWYIMNPEEMDYRNDSYRLVFAVTDSDNQFEVRGGSSLEDSTMIKHMNELGIAFSVVSTMKLEPEYRHLYSDTGGEFFDIDSSVFFEDMVRKTEDIIFGETAEMELKLSEPRMLVNISLCYLADDENSQSDGYLERIMGTMDAYSRLMAQATDGHCYVNNVLILTADSLMDFFTKTDRACMADIQMHTTVSDSESIRANAISNGYYSTLDDYESSLNLNYFDPPNETQYKNRTVFSRIQIGAKTGSYGTIYSNPGAIARVMMHESGHYIFGFFDEYMDPTKTTWTDRGQDDKPYYCFGLMDNQHEDIEISKRYIDYAYLGSYFSDFPIVTYHYNVYWAACEDVLADLLETGVTHADETKLNSYFTPHDEPVFNIPYRAHYTKCGYVWFDSDRTAEYPEATLGFANFTVLDADGNETSTASANSLSWLDSVVLAIGEDPDDYKDSGDRRKAKAQFTEYSGVIDGDLMKLSFEDKDLSSIYVLLKKWGEKDYTVVEVTENEDGTGTAELPISLGELAEIVIAEKDPGGTLVFDSFHVDRSEPAEGYMYESMDGKVIAYGTSQEDTAFTFVADDSSYEQGEFSSLNQATHVFTDGGTMDGGQIYSVVSCTGDVDFSSITWYHYDGEKWTPLPTELTMDENYNVGATADLTGEGIYVLMGKPPANEKAETPECMSYERSDSVDGRIKVIFEDHNENSKYYYVYYSDNLELNPDFDEMPMEVYEAGNCERLSETERALTLTLPERGKMYVVYMETVLEDGSRSGLASMLVQAPEADRDGDGIPDWFMDKYGLWSSEHPEAVAGNDADGDGWTNWQEYRRGTNPLVPDGQLRLSKRPRG